MLIGTKMRDYLTASFPWTPVVRSLATTQFPGLDHKVAPASEVAYW